jgi:hypothetical protein
VAFGGPRTLLVSRAIAWLEITASAFIWVAVIVRLARLRLGAAERAMLAWVALVLAVHSRPIMAKEAVDGLFLVSSGVLLCLGRRPAARLVGYALIGAACLCKQNLAPMAPAALLAFGDLRSPRAWAAAASAPLLYGVAIGALGGGSDALAQLTTQTDFVRYALRAHFVRRDVWLAMAIGLGVMLVGYGWPVRRGGAGAAAGARARAAVAAAALTTGIVWALIQVGEGRFMRHFAHELFGAAVGINLFRSAASGPNDREVRVTWLAIVLAWSLAVSKGGPFPALAAAPLAATLLVCAVELTGLAVPAAVGRRLIAGVLGVLALLAGVSLHRARTEHVYRDLPAQELRSELGDALPGAAGIYSNANTHAFFADLEIALGRVEGQTYALLPDCAMHWVTASQGNPLPIDWAQGTELGSPAVWDRFVSELDARRGGMIVLLQKERVHSLAKGFVPLSTGPYRHRVVGWVRRNLDRFDETEHFELYR